MASDESDPPSRRSEKPSLRDVAPPKSAGPACRSAPGSPAASEPAIAELVSAVRAFAEQIQLSRWSVAQRRNANGEWVIVLIVEDASAVR